MFAATDDEADAIRRRTGRRGAIVVVPPLAPAAAPGAVGRLAGADRFVLLHAPIGPAGNALLVARCAALAGMPLVVAGPVVDASYLERVREFGGPGLVVLAGEPAPGIAAGLRAAAGVVVDAGWVGDGGSRLAAAALAGTRLALADRRRFDGPARAARRFDPADAAALTRALGEAWDDALRAPARRAPETVAALAPGAVVRAIVRGYAAIATAVAWCDLNRARRASDTITRRTPTNMDVQTIDQIQAAAPAAAAAQPAGQPRAAAPPAAAAEAAARCATRRCTARSRIWSAAVRTSPCSSRWCTAPTRS